MDNPCHPYGLLPSTCTGQFFHISQKSFWCPSLTGWSLIWQEENKSLKLTCLSVNAPETIQNDPTSLPHPSKQCWGCSFFSAGERPDPCPSESGPQEVLPLYIPKIYFFRFWKSHVYLEISLCQSPSIGMCSGLLFPLQSLKMSSETTKTSRMYIKSDSMTNQYFVAGLYWIWVQIWWGQGNITCFADILFSSVQICKHRQWAVEYWRGTILYCLFAFLSELFSPPIWHLKQNYQMSISPSWLIYSHKHTKEANIKSCVCLWYM